MKTEERPTNLAVVACCATCRHMRDGEWCNKWDIAVLSQTKCDTYERRMDIPMWIIVAPKE
jgi:hypothetical protein